MPAVEVKNLCILNEKKLLVQGVSFCIEQGKTLALMGASGSGKSLTAMALMQALPPKVYFKAEYIKFSGKNPALIMQNPGDCFDPLFSIEQTFLETFNLPKPELKLYMFKLLKEVGLDKSIAKFYPFELSGGMLHKVMIALAIGQVEKNGASCIIADEPIAGLDSSSKLLLLQHLKILQQKYRFALLYIDHDLAFAKLMADDLAIMQAGKIIEFANLQDILQNPQQEYTQKLLQRFKNVDAIASYHIGHTEQHANKVILQCKGINKYFAKKPALHNINFELLEGENLGIVGNNGAGKSTLLKIILGLEPATSGEVHILHKNINELRHERSWRKHIQAVFQHARLAINPRLCVHDILMEPLRAHDFRGDEKSKVAELLSLVKLPTHYTKAYPQQLSGGQLQRLCIARALALGPDILLLDEPITDLDAVVAEEIILMLNDIRKKLNITLLYISHDIGSVLRLCERILVLDKGQVVDNFKTCQYQSSERHQAFKDALI